LLVVPLHGECHAEAIQGPDVAGVDFEHPPIVLDGPGVVFGRAIDVGQTVVGGDAAFFQIEGGTKLLLRLRELSPAVIDEAEIGSEFRRIEAAFDRLPVDPLGPVILIELNVRPADMVVEDGDATVFGECHLEDIERTRVITLAEQCEA